MANIPVLGYQAFWTNARETFKAEFQRLVGQHPDAEEQLRQLFAVLSDIEDVAGRTATSVGECQEWTSIVSTVEETRTNYCNAISGKTPYCALCGTYTVTLQEPKGLLKANIQSEGNETAKQKNNNKNNNNNNTHRANTTG
jgi:hypothetical protein